LILKLAGGNILAQKTIPRFGTPSVTQNDNGTPFASKVTPQLPNAFAIDWHSNIYIEQCKEQIVH